MKKKIFTGNSRSAELCKVIKQYSERGKKGGKFAVFVR